MENNQKSTLSNNRIYVDVHVIQTVPPGCVNRDDTGSPKTAVYGGIKRARVSSQSWKKAIRKEFKELLPEEQLGLRTKKIVSMVAKEIAQLDGAVNAEEAAQKALECAGLKIKSVEKGTDALFFLSTAQAKALAKLAVEESEAIKKASKETKVKAQNALRENPSIDIALFGRMVADEASLNTDASAQVAHSISTHKVINEFDYFTAVDDDPNKDNAGAGHIGAVEFNSSTLYRYANVAVHELNKYLENDTAASVCHFIKAFVCSMPDGKQNSFANRTLPDAVLVTLRTDQPINLVGAFEKPVPMSEEGYVTASANRLVKHAHKVYNEFADEPEISLVTGALLSELGSTRPLKDLLKDLEAELDKRLGLYGGQV